MWRANMTRLFTQRLRAACTGAFGGSIFTLSAPVAPDSGVMVEPLPMKGSQSHAHFTQRRYS